MSSPKNTRKNKTGPFFFIARLSKGQKPEIFATKVTLNNSKIGPSGSATGRFKDEDSIEERLRIVFVVVHMG